MTFDTKGYRKDFPILSQKINGKPLVYLDNAATAQKPQSVIDAVDAYYRTDNANVHRGIHTLSERATDAYEGARAAVAEFIHAGSAEEIIFVRNATEGFNLLAWSWGRTNLHEGDEILLTEMEHHANTIPWQRIAADTGAVLRYVPVDRETGHIDRDAFAQLLSERTRVLSMTHMSNVLGTIPDVQWFTKQAKAQGAVVFVDGAQAAPHLPVDVAAIGCDAYVFTGHKLYGPTGIGAVYIRGELLRDLPPYQTGGGMIETVERDHATYQDPPIRFEAGTPNIAGAVGLKAAIDYVNHIGMDRIREHEISLIGYALEQIRSIPGVTVYGPSEASERGAVLAFTLDEVHPHDLGSLLDREGVAIRSGHHCTQILHREVLKQLATARASFALYNGREDVDRFIAALQKIRQTFIR